MMKRRDFFGKSGCSALGMMLAYFGLTSCKKKEEDAAAEETTQSEAQSPAQETAPEVMSQKEMVKKMLMEKQGKTAEEADAILAEFEGKLPMFKQQCICKTCPTYVAEETELSFCHPLIGKSKIITDEKGCNCPQCPVYTENKLKNGYYCTRKSEMEQEMAKMA
jgi:hypothetical protein